jgi:hypothetical protein
MKCIEIIAAAAAATEVHTKHTNTLYGQNEEFLNVKSDGKKSDD